MRRPGDIIGEKYRIIRVLGHGGMGSVFEAINERIDRHVAIKILHEKHASEDDINKRFVREAKSAATIGSNHIVDVIDAGEESGTPYIVMEHLEGDDLSTLLFKEGPLAPQRAVTLVIQACRGLEAAHRKGIIHRDMKPENLFVTSGERGEERVKVLDFGIAKFRGPKIDEETTLTETGVSLGTPMYMSPEQLRETREVDHRSDIYSVGVILYELLTGQLPYRPKSFAELIILMTTTTPTPLRQLRPELDPKLELVVLRAMAQKLDDRYASIIELIDALEPFTGIHTATVQSRGASDDESSKTDRPGEPIPRGWNKTTPVSAAEENDHLEDDAVSADVFAQMALDSELQRPPWNKMWLVIGIGGALVVVAILAFPSLTPRERAPTAPTSEVSQRLVADAFTPQREGSKNSAVTTDASHVGDGAPNENLVTISLVGVPEGATMVFDGRAVEDHRVEVQRSTRSVVIHLEQHGRVSWRKQVTLDRHQTFELDDVATESNHREGERPLKHVQSSRRAATPDGGERAPETDESEERRDPGFLDGFPAKMQGE